MEVDGVDGPAEVGGPVAVEGVDRPAGVGCPVGVDGVGILMGQWNGQQRQGLGSPEVEGLPV